MDQGLDAVPVTHTLVWTSASCYISDNRQTDGSFALCLNVTAVHWCCLWDMLLQLVLSAGFCLFSAVVGHLNTALTTVSPGRSFTALTTISPGRSFTALTTISPGRSFTALTTISPGSSFTACVLYFFSYCTSFSGDHILTSYNSVWVWAFISSVICWDGE